MFGFYLTSLALVAFAHCATVPQSSNEPVPIVNQESLMDPEGSFKWSYESADGSKQEQVGELKALDKDNTVETVQGSYSYVDPEGKNHVISYVANENGYFPQGDDIAPEVLSNIEYIAAHPQPINTEQQFIRK